MKRNENSYKKSGVNISLANQLVKHIAIESQKNVKKENNNSLKDKLNLNQIQKKLGILNQDKLCLQRVKRD